MITLTIGISNSGKTTWAEAQVGHTNINRDDLRAEQAGGNLKDYRFSKAKENKITALQHSKAKESIAQGIPVIISDTNLNPKTRNAWITLAVELGVGMTCKEFPCEPHIAKTRNIKRDYSVPPSVIDQQYSAWRKYQSLPQAKPFDRKATSRAIIYDMDGTLADMTGIRRPFDWDSVDKDKPRYSVVDHARIMHQQGYTIIIMSGRDGSCENLTRHWLGVNGVPYKKLFMRKAGDQRPDAVIKEELYFKHVDGNYNVQFVVDDRDQMVSRWRALGLECWQVQPGPF